MCRSDDMPRQCLTGWRPDITDARLTYYRADRPHRLHVHDGAHVSLLLAGGLEETVGDSIECGWSGYLRVRPAEFRHAVTFGRHGALILTLPVREGWLSIPDLAGKWHPVRRRDKCREIVRNLLCSRLCDAEYAATELLALASPLDRPRARPPAWLVKAHEAIVEQPTVVRIGALAERSGVHRVHFARAFYAHYGSLPSVARRRAMLDRAIDGVVEAGTTLADVASAAGFADQAHMCRAFREFLGASPVQLRALAT
jgi:AraC-like DNA-binding protein